MHDFLIRNDSGQRGKGEKTKEGVLEGKGDQENDVLGNVKSNVSGVEILVDGEIFFFLSYYSLS